MPMLDLGQRLRELGRIRTGVQKPNKSGEGTHPAKLDTFRLTSQSKPLMDAAARAYGGTVQEWRDDGVSGTQWELITEVGVLDAILPPRQAFSQFWELWSGGGCQRRCTGEYELLSMQDCLCPQDHVERSEAAKASPPTACKPTTRLNLILPHIPDLGVWRLESHSYYAAVELAATEQLCALATERRWMIPVRLRLEQREVKRPGQGVRRFAVPVVELSVTVHELFESLGGSISPAFAMGSTAPALGDGNGSAADHTDITPPPDEPTGSMSEGDEGIGTSMSAADTSSDGQLEQGAPRADPPAPSETSTGPGYGEGPGPVVDSPHAFVGDDPNGACAKCHWLMEAEVHRGVKPPKGSRA